MRNRKKEYLEYNDLVVENARLIIEIEDLKAELRSYAESVFTLQANGFLIKYNLKDKFIQILEGTATPQQVYSAAKEH